VTKSSIDNQDNDFTQKMDVSENDGHEIDAQENDAHEIDGHENKANESDVLEAEIYELDESYLGERLDIVLVSFYPAISRSRIQSWIKAGQVKLDGEVINKPKHKVTKPMFLSVVPKNESKGEWTAEDIDFTVHYEDDDIIIVNKRAGLVVHPAPGHRQDTLVNGLLFRYPELRKMPRAGIVHRLDKDTTGLLVVAKTPEAHFNLVDQLQNRAFKREYVALVHHTLVAGDTINLPIGRHPQQRKKMAVIEDDRVDEFGDLIANGSRSKEAITHYRITQKFQHFTQLRVQLETGRTHQIRVHFAHIHHPLVGDPLYLPRNLRPRNMSKELEQLFDDFRRQALHAETLGLIHPTTGEFVSWQTDIPEDLNRLIEQLKIE
jgi:23S rRNA pseudouridine1911/1915/1917 synthase